MSMKTVKIIDGICIFLFILMGLYIFIIPDKAQDLLLPVFTVVNPYRTGGWIMGIGFLVTCIYGNGKTGLRLGIVMIVCYLITAFISLVGLIVMTSGWDLLWYLHPLLVIAGIIVLIRNRKKK